MIRSLAENLAESIKSSLLLGLLLGRAVLAALASGCHSRLSRAAQICLKISDFSFGLDLHNIDKCLLSLFVKVL